MALFTTPLDFFSMDRYNQTGMFGSYQIEMKVMWDRLMDNFYDEFHRSVDMKTRETRIYLQRHPQPWEYMGGLTFPQEFYNCPDYIQYVNEINKAFTQLNKVFADIRWMILLGEYDPDTVARWVGDLLVTLWKTPIVTGNHYERHQSYPQVATNNYDGFLKNMYWPLLELYLHTYEAFDFHIFEKIQDSYPYWYWEYMPQFISEFTDSEEQLASSLYYNIEFRCQDDIRTTKLVPNVWHFRGYDKYRVMFYNDIGDSKIDYADLNRLILKVETDD